MPLNEETIPATAITPRPETEPRFVNGDTPDERAKLVEVLRKTAKTEDGDSAEKPKKAKPAVAEDDAESDKPEDDEKPKAKAKAKDEKKSPPTPKKAKADDETSDEEDEKPAPKRKAKSDDEEDESESSPAKEEGEEGEDEKPAAAKGDEEPEAEASEDDEDDAEAKAKAEKAAKMERLKARIEAEKKRQREAIQRNRALEQERQRAIELQRAIEQERKQREELEKRVSGLRDKPLDVLRDLGVAPEEIVKRAVEDGSPEAILRREREALAKLREEIAAEREAMRRAQQEHLQQQRLVAVRNAFVTEARNESLYPSVAAIASDDPDFVIEMAESVARKAYQNTGYHYGNDEILEVLEQRLSKRNKSAQQERAPSNSKVKTQETTNGSGAQAKIATGTTRTLTAKTASQRATSGGSIDDLSPEEERKALAKLFRERAGRG